MTTLSVAQEVAPGDVRTFDVLRWEHPAEVIDPVQLAGEAYRKPLSPVSAGVPLSGFLLDADDDDRFVACGRDATHAWVVHRYMLPVRPRKNPLKSLIATGADVRQVMFTEQIGAALWARWHAGKAVRYVRLGLVDDDAVRGTLQDFERPQWDGTLPPEQEPVIVELPPSEHLDPDELIAKEPPEHLEVTDEGRFLLTFDPYWQDEDQGLDRWPPGSFFRSDVEGGDHVFLNLDTLNYGYQYDDTEAFGPDHGDLVRAAVATWFDLTWDLTTWDWPVDVYRVQRR